MLLDSRLKVGSTWLEHITNKEHTIIHVAIAGAGNNVAWKDSDDKFGGGLATEFLNTHTYVKQV